MALQTIENYRGIELNAAYHKIGSIHLDMQMYKDVEARENNVILDTYSVNIPVSAEVYNELKKLEKFEEAIDC